MGGVAGRGRGANAPGRASGARRTVLRGDHHHRPHDDGLARAQGAGRRLLGLEHGLAVPVLQLRHAVGRRAAVCPSPGRRLGAGRAAHSAPRLLGRPLFYRADDPGALAMPMDPGCARPRPGLGGPRRALRAGHRPRPAGQLWHRRAVGVLCRAPAAAGADGVGRRGHRGQCGRRLPLDVRLLGLAGPGPGRHRNRQRHRPLVHLPVPADGGAAGPALPVLPHAGAGLAARLAALPGDPHGRPAPRLGASGRNGVLRDHHLSGRPPGRGSSGRPRHRPPADRSRDHDPERPVPSGDGASRPCGGRQEPAWHRPCRLDRAEPGDGLHGDGRPWCSCCSAKT